jgi:hypothetical protein
MAAGERRSDTNAHGLVKARLPHLLIVTGANLDRVGAWLTEWRRATR